MFVKNTILLFTIVLIASTSMSCYNVYNITLEGNFSEEKYLRIRKISGLEDFNTNCIIEEDYLYCNESFWFHGTNKLYSEPFIFEEYSYPQNFSEDMDKYLSYSSGEWVNISKEFISESESYLDLVIKIVSWVRENIRYVDNFRHLSNTFRDSEGNCESFSKLSVNMLRSVNIPSRVVYGWRGDEAHAWIEVYYPSGGWVSIDPTFGSYGYLGEDYIFLGYDKMSYMKSNKRVNLEGYIFKKVSERDCVLELRKRSNFIYNPYKSILTHRVDDFGSYPLVIPPGYSLDQEIRGVTTKASLYDRILGVFLTLQKLFK